MRPAEDIGKLIRKLNDKTSARMDERVIGDILRALEESGKTSTAIQPNIGRIIMKSPVTKLAAGRCGGDNYSNSAVNTTLE
ncbi:MAG: hypothetical protein ACYSW8_16400 [Planctomycetota bacterium]|jgi:hypothetical protein